MYCKKEEFARSLIRYFEKSTGVFNGDGVITQEQLKEIQQRAKAPKNIWHGFISLNKEMSYKIDTPEKCMRLIKRTFGEFFKDMGLDPNNIDLISVLHQDKPHHLHIHFWFAEKEPKCKYRKKFTEYKHKRKIDKSVLDRMHVRLNLDIMESHPKLYVSLDEAFIFQSPPIRIAVRVITRCKECGVHGELVMLWDGHEEDRSMHSSRIDRGYTDFSYEKAQNIASGNTPKQQYKVIFR